MSRAKSRSKKDDEDIDEVTGLTITELETAIDDLYLHRDEAAGPEVAVEHADEIRSVVSVRFNRAEVDALAAAAAEAGLALSTYVRNAALAAAGAIDLETARRELHAAAQALDELGRSLGSAA